MCLCYPYAKDRGSVFHSGYSGGGSINRNELLNDITNAVKINMSKVSVNRGIPPTDLPEKPGRFKLVNPFGNTGMGAMISASGQSAQVPVCENALMVISSSDTTATQYGERTSFNLCVYQYKFGYQVDIYVSFTEVTGGFSPQVLGATITKSLMGGNSQFIPRTIAEVKNAIGKHGAVTVVDSYIPESFAGAFYGQKN